MLKTKHTACSKYFMYDILWLYPLQWFAVWINSISSCCCFFFGCLTLMSLYPSNYLVLEGPLRCLGFVPVTKILYWVMSNMDFIQINFKAFYFICSWMLSSSSVITSDINLAIGYVLVNTHQSNPSWNWVFPEFGRSRTFLRLLIKEKSIDMCLWLMSTQRSVSFESVNGWERR